MIYESGRKSGLYTKCDTIVYEKIDSMENVVSPTSLQHKDDNVNSF